MVEPSSGPREPVSLRQAMMEMLGSMSPQEQVVARRVGAMDDPAVWEFADGWRDVVRPLFDELLDEAVAEIVTDKVLSAIGTRLWELRTKPQPGSDTTYSAMVRLATAMRGAALR